MPLMLALVLSSCGNRTPNVSPQSGNLPERPVIYLRADSFKLLDVKGDVAIGTDLFWRGDVEAVRFEALADSGFSLGATAGGRPDETRFGPYQVQRIDESPLRTPDLLLINRSWETDAVFLSFSEDFPAYQLEINAHDGPKAHQLETILLLKGQTFLGVNPCFPSTYDWAATKIDFRVAGLSSSGMISAKGPWTHLRAPVGAQASAAAYAVDWLVEHGFELSGLGVAMTALLVLWRRRRIKI